MSDENLCPECGLSIAECNRRALGRIHRGRDAMDFISDAPPGTLSVWPEDKSLPEGWKANAPRLLPRPAHLSCCGPSLKSEGGPD
jgi:hypothetical protein